LSDRARQKLILALDFSTLSPAIELAETVSSSVGMFKINIQLFTSEGPSAVEQVARLAPAFFWT
jgi:orotidine-5'-phosphate decarboxylase